MKRIGFGAGAVAVWATLVVAATVVTPMEAAAQAQAPIPIVERHMTIRDRQVRTSLFSNGVVVVSGRRDGERIFFRQVQLTAAELEGYVSALERDAIELAEADELPRHEDSRGYGVVTLHLGPKSPLQFSYSSMTVYDLATTRLLNTIDDLEQSVIWREPTGAGIEGWEPEIGDRVKLRAGGFAKVLDVQRDGTIIIEHDVTYINEIIPESQRKNVIYEVLDGER
jgi:hypothetical protein